MGLWGDRSDIYIFRYMFLCESYSAPWINPINKTDKQQEIAWQSNLCFLEYDINNTQMFNDTMSKFSHEKSQGCRLNWPSVQPAMKQTIHHFSRRTVQLLMSQGYKSFPNQWLKNTKHIFLVFRNEKCPNLLPLM